MPYIRLFLRAFCFLSLSHTNYIIVNRESCDYIINMDVSETIRQIRAASALPPTSIDEEGRKALLQACEALRVSLENPLEFAMKTMFAVGPTSAQL